MIRDIFISLDIELLKMRKSMIFWVTIAAACFITLILGLMMVLVMNPGVLPPGILKTKIAMAAISADWPSFIGFVEMASGAIGIIIFGFAVSWIFGREYTDHTIKDLLALPTSRTSIVISKLITVALWCTLIGAIIFTLSIFLGLLIKLPLWSAGLIPPFCKIFIVTTLLSILLCPPVAFVASAGKGVLPAIGFVVLCMGLANFFGNIGLGAYFPWTIPMLYTGAVGANGNHLPLASYIIIISTGLIGTIGTALQWKYADQNK